MRLEKIIKRIIPSVQKALLLCVLSFIMEISTGFFLKLSFVQPRLITSDTSDRIGSKGQRLRLCLACEGRSCLRLSR